MSPFDLIVVGAGPAGTMAAREAAGRGARVALVDGSHPREKACGGGVTGRALDLVGELPGNAGSDASGHAIDAAVFEARGRSVRVGVTGGDVLRVYSRAALDAALLRRAIAAGAVHVAARATRVARDGVRWAVDIGGTEPLRAPWLLGADGPGGITRRQVFRPFSRAQLSIAAGSFVDGVSVSDIAIAFTNDPPGYFWSFPRRDHLAAGTCAQADISGPQPLHAFTDAWLDRYAPAAGRPRRRYAWPIPSLRANDLEEERPAGRGWMLLGDAAGLVDPITREGIYFALRSGQLAAAALASRDPASTYAEGVRDELHAELRRAARLKAAFFRPHFTGLLLDALEQSAAIRAVMIDLIGGRQPYAGLKRRLLGTLEFGLMWKLVASHTTL